MSGERRLSMEVLKEYDEVTCAFIDDDGYPLAAPVSYELHEATGKLSIRIPKGIEPQRISEKVVNVIFNHITPLPSGGYTDRRYLSVRGKAQLKGDELIVEPTKIYGWDERSVPFPEYCEVTVPRARRYLERTGRELGRLFKPKISPIMTFFRATRLPFLMATLAPVSTGAAVAAYHGYFSALLFLFTLLGVALIHMGLNLANDYFDTKLGADPINKKPTPFSGGSRVLIYGMLSLTQAQAMMGLLFASGVAIGLYLAFTRGLLEILGLTAIGLFLSIFYTAPPLKLAYRGLGELAVAIGFGPVVVMGSYFVQTQRFALEPLIASIPVGVLIMLILYVNEVPDLEYDRAAGKMTLLTRLDRKDALGLYKAFLASVYALVALSVLAGTAPLTALLALATIPMAREVYKGVEQTYGSPYAMIPHLAKNVNLAILTSLLLATGYAIVAILPL